MVLDRDLEIMIPLSSRHSRTLFVIVAQSHSNINASSFNMSQKRKVIGSVQRAIDILDLFDAHTQEFGVTEIALSMGLPKSTVAGLIYTLEQNGYLEQNPQNRKYRLGYKLAERTGILLQQYDLRQTAAPILEDLRDECQESVNLAIRDGDDVVYIERMHGMNMLGMRSEIGKREKLHSTALGKALLAYLPVEEIKKIIENYEFTTVTSQTITRPVAFLFELEATRKRGFALDNQENELGGRCVAAAIKDYRDETVAAVSISVPLQRMPDERIAVLGNQVIRAAKEISKKLGAPGNGGHER